MASRLHNLTIDCDDHYVLMQWWKRVLDGYDDDPLDPNHPGDPMSALVGPAGSPRLLFIPVPETKTVKNRLHLDLRSTDLAAATDQALALGATRADDVYDGGRWQVLRDPEGNEFCLT